MHRALLLVIMYCLARCGALPYNKEPLCTSRYDFEEKILEKVLRMELWMETMKTRVDTDLDKTAKDIDKFTLGLRDMKMEITDKMTEVDTSVKALERKTDAKLVEVDQNVSDNMDTQFKNLEAKANAKLQDMEELVKERILEMKRNPHSSKPDVAFHAKNVKGQPAQNQVIKFTSTLENVGHGYNLATGCFTAPINGTYWFSAQICTHTKKFVTPSIVIRGIVVTRAFVYSENQVDVSSVHAVSVLQVSDTVCLETGPVMSSPIYNKENDCFGNFMGALIN